MIIIDGCHCPRAVNPRPLSEGYPIGHYMAAALIGEFSRVALWHERHDPDTGQRYSWLSAMRAAAENPPAFDRMWDEVFEDAPTLVMLPA